MPELPEVETVRRTLNKLINGEKILSIDVHYSKMIHEDTIEDFKNQLIGKTILDIKRYGKYLIFIFEDIALISHLRMEGKYFIKDQSEPVEKHEHIVFNFLSGSSLRYHDVRKFGTMELKQLNEIYCTNPIAKLGFEPGDKRLTVSYLKAKLHHRSTAIKSCLLDQTIITGLGNIYVDEVLFLSKIDPETKPSSLSNTDYKNLIKHATDVLEKAVELGGTTIRSYTSSLGVTGLFQINLNVHTMKGLPCPVCHTIIEKKKVNGRGSYYCPSCQKRK
ncbi:MAG: DNA-formamidopyrimidine glycosylase [Bacilli bacterium]|nr:DNA-formamidopyrimidine glycosylase [Bacilli bacterium]